MPKTRKSRSRESSSTSRGKIPLGPNYTGSDPQFGSIHDLPRGLKRQTAVFNLLETNTDGEGWYRLTFRFPECVGIAETLNMQAKKGECIPTLSMNVKILVPVVKNFKIEIIRSPPDYTITPEIIGHDASVQTPRYITTDVKPTKVAFILTGDDQLTTKVPDIADEDKTVTASHAEVVASISNAIYAQYWDNPDSVAQVAEMAEKVNILLERAKGGFKTPHWNNKDPASIAELLYYDNYTAALMQMSTGQVATPKQIIIDNIMEKGHTLTSDHVNLFINNNYKCTPLQGGEPDAAYRRPRYFTFKTTLDYTTKQVDLSSLLIWKRQLKEFLPKQIQWRMLETVTGAKANRWEIALSRGSIKESGVGNDPSSKTDFPDIEEEKIKVLDDEE